MSEKIEVPLTQVARMVAQAQKRPDSRLIVKLKGMVLSQSPYTKADKSVTFQSKFFHPETESVISFYGPDQFEKMKILELEFVLSGFNATILKRPGLGIK